MRPVTYIGFILALIAVLTWTGAEAGDYRLLYLNRSDHVKDVRFNEDNNGAGFEWRVGGDDWIGLMHFKNSIYEDSTALYYHEEHGDDIKWGYQIGGTTGYSEDYAVVPWVMFFMQWPIGEHYRLRVVGFPSAVIADQHLLEW